MKINNKTWRIVNILFISAILINVVLLIYRIIDQIQSLDSPLLPKYVSIYMYGSEINLTCFTIGALIPALFLTFKKQYIYSVTVMVLFLIVGFLLREQVLIYQNFYLLTKYL